MKLNMKRTISIALIFLLIISIITPFYAQQATAAESISVADAIANNTGSASVHGYIVGYMIDKANVDLEAPFPADTNIIIADSPDEKDIKKMLPVRLKSSLRAQFGLSTNPTNSGKKVEITGTLGAYFTLPGISEVSAMKFLDGGGEPVENQVEAVTVSISSSSVPKDTEITLSTKTDGAAIYYTTDGSVPTTTSTKYETPIVIDQDMTIKAIATKEGLENSTMAEFTYTVLSDDAILSIAEARAKAEGETITIKGIVAANLKNSISVQDATGGIAVRPTSLAAKVGDEVTLSGKLDNYNGLLQLSSATIVTKSEGVGAPAPKIVTGAEVNEDNESLLVQAKQITLTAENAENYTATDGTTEFIVRDENNSLGLSVGTTYESITGIVQQFNTDYQIIPRSVQDIVSDSTILQPVAANPSSGTFVGGTTVTLSTATAGAEIFYTVDGTEPTKASAKYTAPIIISENTTLKAVAITPDGTASEITTFDYKVTDSLQIHDIQGAGHTSPFIGQTVEGIEGVVTYAFNLKGNNYYTIQTPDALADDNPNTSEAVLLFSGNKSLNVQIGDLVSVKGGVSEYAYDGYDDRQKTDLKTTQINVRDDQGGKVEVIKNGVTLPSPIVIDETKMSLKDIDSDNLSVFNPTVDAIDFWESIEGMRVEVGNVKAVAPQEHGDLITVLEKRQTNSLHGGVLLVENNQNADRIQFRLEPNSPARDFEVATGDKFEGPITGVVGYSFQNYKVYVSLNEMKAAHTKGTATPEKTTIVKANDKLTIASYNLENFSNNLKTTTEDKAKKLARAIATDMQSPDIVGVTEVQDNNGPDSGNSQANQSYERLIAAIKKEGGPTYKYVNIDPEYNEDGGQSNANIRVGFLYNSERVSLTEGIPTGDATTSVNYKNGKLTHNPGRIDPTNAAFNSSRKPLVAQFEFQGESVVVIANHWNSKNGDTPLFGAIQPPKYESEVQRHKIANIVYNFVKDIKSKNPDANVVSVGDFNDYQFSTTLKIHEGTLMTNMINKVETADRYTYLFQGNSQVLDHILVSKNLEPKTKVDILHINADFTDMAGRASDHDPVMVQIDILAEDVVTPTEAEHTYTISNLQTKKLTITKQSVAVSLDGKSVITEGVSFTGAYAEFHGEGFEKHNVTIKPASAGAVIDFKGTVVKKVTIDGTNVKEIRGAEGIQEFEFVNGADRKNIKITNTKGEPIEVPSFPNDDHTLLSFHSSSDSSILKIITQYIFLKDIVTIHDIIGQ